MYSAAQGSSVENMLVEATREEQAGVGRERMLERMARQEVEEAEYDQYR